MTGTTARLGVDAYVLAAFLWPDEQPEVGAARIRQWAQRGHVEVVDYARAGRTRRALFDPAAVARHAAQNRTA
ncbi:MAG: hypothetical protein GEV10_16095 [Streptosporangiales bacterium]|nr:hypothetical protein [Streptosporangiales bacterium]